MKTWFLVAVLANVVAIGCTAQQKKAPKQEEHKGVVGFGYWTTQEGRTTGR